MDATQAAAAPEDLVRRCDEIFDASGAAIEWAGKVRGNARRLDLAVDGLTKDLRRARNACRRLGRAAARPLSIGVFGMSQAGKSYLISTLARGADGRLQTMLDSHKLDFIADINPPGGGKEATGLVTRFTRQRNDPPNGYPIELTLFSEADLVKVLGNSYFNDFDRERTAEIKPETVVQHVAALRSLRQPNPTGGLDEDDMVDLLDYFGKRYGKSMEALKPDFWDEAVGLAPRLPPAARGKLLSVLWGIDNTALTDIYVRLRDALASIGGARTVFVPLTALVRPKGSGFQWSPSSILNVDVLNRLGKDEGELLTVLPMTDGKPGPVVPLPRSLLAALTAEMTFVLADPPVAGLLEHVDLLDFPGYRGRLKIANLDEVRKDPKLADANPVAQLLLRGKVAFLFERYTDDQEMNLLIMCTRCDMQIEITELKPVLDTWVEATQGETPADRARRPPGLIWVITQLDKRLTPKPGTSEALQREEWSSMIHITLLERFASCAWLDDWANGRPFNNVFLVRKPGFLGAVIDTIETAAGVEERDLLPGEKNRLASQRAIFTDTDNVARHIGEPAEAWDAVLTPNDGGMKRLAMYLDRVALKEIKLERIAEQVLSGAETIGKWFAPYFRADDTGELEKKKKLAEEVSDAIKDPEHPERAESLGELLARLQPSAEILRRLYLRTEVTTAEAGGDSPASTEAKPRRRGLIILNTPSKEMAEPKPAVSGRAFMFAQLVLREWTSQVRGLPTTLELQRFLDLPADILQIIVDEVLTGAVRYLIEDRLIKALQPLEEKRSTTRIGIVDQQVLLARCVINDYIDTLGFSQVKLDERPESPLGGRKIFQSAKVIPIGEQPSLPDEEVNYSGMFVLDWLLAFYHLATGNAGHSAGREITWEQNEELRDILAAISGTAGAAATA
ncbi:MAG: virulence factor SrfC family protein [Rhodospirillales bacterium]